MIIWICDDDRMTVDKIKIMIQNHYSNMDICCFYSFDDMKDQEQLPDILIMDIVLDHELDGIDIVKEIQNKKIDCNKLVYKWRLLKFLSQTFKFRKNTNLNVQANPME